jgi:hypothetical protein
MQITIEVKKEELKNPTAFLRMAQEIIEKSNYILSETKGLESFKIMSDNIRTIQRAEAIIRKYK